MKKTYLLVFAVLMVVISLTACGSKSKEAVVKDLSNKLEKIEGYKVEATMTLEMGKEPQTYEVEIWHKNPSFYRVNLKNSQKDQNQMILRNDDGVFVLTPALNKSFRFQSDWPQNSSQAYLYESLIQDIIEDKEAKFTSTENQYIFETKTRYQNNKMLPIQEITLNKKDLSPATVKVMDSDRNPLVTVKFSKTDFNASFEKNDFDMAKNMTRAQFEVPVMAEVGDEDWVVKYPSAEIQGVELIEEETISTDNGKRVVLTYGGERSFTLIQEKSSVDEVSVVATPVSGELIDLGITIGALSKNNLRWTYQGIDYTLASNDLSTEELIMVARSLEEQGEIIK